MAASAARQMVYLPRERRSLFRRSCDPSEVANAVQAALEAGFRDGQRANPYADILNSIESELRGLEADICDPAWHQERERQSAPVVSRVIRTLEFCEQQLARRNHDPGSHL